MYFIATNNLYKLNSSFVVQWQIVHSSTIFDAVVDNANGAITFVSAQYIMNLSTSNGSTNWQWFFPTVSYSSTFKTVTIDSANNFWVTYAILNRSGTPRIGYTYTVQSGFARFLSNGSGWGIFGEYNLVTPTKMVVAGITPVFTGSSSSGPVVNYYNVAGGYMTTSDSNYTNFSNSFISAMCLDSTASNAYIAFNSTSSSTTGYYNSLIMKASLSSSLGSTFQPAYSFTNPALSPSITAMCTDPSNNLYVLFYDQITGYYFLTKLNSSFAVQWSNQINYTVLPQLTSIFYHPTFGIVLSGFEQNSINSNNDGLILNVPIDGTHNNHSTAVNAGYIYTSYAASSPTASVYTSNPSSGNGIGASGGIASIASSVNFVTSSISNTFGSTGVNCVSVII